MNCYFSHCQLVSIQNGKVERAWLFIPDQDSDSFLTVHLRVSCKLTHCPERLLYRVARIGGRRPAQCPHTPSMRASPLSLSAHQQRALLHICNWTVTLEHCTDCVLLLSQLKRCFIFWVLFTHFFPVLFLYFFIPPGKFQLQWCIRCVMFPSVPEVAS